MAASSFFPHAASVPAIIKMKIQDLFFVNGKCFFCDTAFSSCECIWRSNAPDISYYSDWAADCKKWPK